MKPLLIYNRQDVTPIRKLILMHLTNKGKNVEEPACYIHPVPEPTPEPNEE